MPDICMCRGGDCPLKKECYRYRAIPCQYAQSYFGSPPFKDEGCEYFASLEGWGATDGTGTHIRGLKECELSEKRVARAQEKHRQDREV